MGKITNLPKVYEGYLKRVRKLRKYVKDLYKADGPTEEVFNRLLDLTVNHIPRLCAMQSDPKKVYRGEEFETDNELINHTIQFCDVSYEALKSVVESFKSDVPDTMIFYKNDKGKQVTLGELRRIYSALITVRKMALDMVGSK